MTEEDVAVVHDSQFDWISKHYGESYACRASYGWETEYDVVVTKIPGIGYLSSGDPYGHDNGPYHEFQSLLTLPVVLDPCTW